MSLVSLVLCMFLKLQSCTLWPHILFPLLQLSAVLPVENFPVMEEGEEVHRSLGEEVEEAAAEEEELAFQVPGFWKCDGELIRRAIENVDVSAVRPFLTQWRETCATR
jgi:hypothetical protein